MIEIKNASHPILTGVTDVFGPSDVYGIRRLTEKDTILLRGAVTKTLDPDSSFVNEKNDPMQPLAWLHPYTAPNGKVGTTFCTTMGASVDLVSEDLRRMLVNAAYHLLGLKVAENADVNYVDPFYPSFYGFIRDKEYWPGQDMQAEDYGLGKTPHAPIPRVLLHGHSDLLRKNNLNIYSNFFLDSVFILACSASFRYRSASFKYAILIAGLLIP